MKARDIIAPVDALGLMLIARCGETAQARKLAKDFEHWLWFPRSWRVPPRVYGSAVRMEKRLRKSVREGDIGLRGELKASDPPDDIDRADCLVGELNVFEQTLTISVQGRRTPARVYRRVFCVRDDVMTIVEAIAKKQSGLTTSKPAADSMIRSVIKSVYDDAVTSGSHPPNINELPDAVTPLLEKQGYKASGRQIKKLGSESQFDGCRNMPGKRVAKQGVT